MLSVWAAAQTWVFAGTARWLQAATSDQRADCQTHLTKRKKGLWVARKGTGRQSETLVRLHRSVDGGRRRTTLGWSSVLQWRICRNRICRVTG